MSLTLCGRWLSKATAHFIERPGLRYRKAYLGKPPGVARTLEQRLAEMNYEDPSLHYRVDIGYPLPRLERKDVMLEKRKARVEAKKNPELELKAKHRKLKVNLDDVRSGWAATSAAAHIYQTAKYYNIYEDLFGESYFYPIIPLSIEFEYLKDESVVTPVYRGNLIKPSEAIKEPEVSYSAQNDELFTLMLTTPDCHLTKEDGEYLHWLVGNIPGSDVRNGEVLCDYMRPFPLRGLGYCRYVFVLYKQDKRIDFSNHKRETPCTNLTARTFSTYDFYRELQNDMTPAGLAFFESNWDHSLTPFFHDVLEMAEPVLEYDFPPVVLAPQKWFPIRKAFNIYLDRYKEPKQLQKELLIEKLKERHPFKPPPTPPRFPLAYHISNKYPSWLKEDIRRRRVKEGKWKFM